MWPAFLSLDLHPAAGKSSRGQPVLPVEEGKAPLERAGGQVGPALVTSGGRLRFVWAFASVEGIFLAVPQEWVRQGLFVES